MTTLTYVTAEGGRAATGTRILLSPIRGGMFETHRVWPLARVGALA